MRYMGQRGFMTVGNFAACTSLFRLPLFHPSNSFSKCSIYIETHINIDVMWLYVLTTGKFDYMQVVYGSINFLGQGKS